MRTALLAIGLVLLPATVLAASFSLVPTTSLFIGQGEMASFDVFYTALPGDAPALAANLRISYDHDRRPDMPPNSVVTISGNNNGNPFDIQILNLAANSENMFLPQNVVDIGGAQQTGPAIDGSEGVKLGEISFGVQGPFTGNAGIITLTLVAPQTGVRSRTFCNICGPSSKVLAVIHVPEPSLWALLLVGIAAMRRRL